MQLLKNWQPVGVVGAAGSSRLPRWRREGDLTP